MESGGDVMDDENDKVSRDVVGVMRRNRIHEFLYPTRQQSWHGQDMSDMTWSHVTTLTTPTMMTNIWAQTQTQIDLIHMIVKIRHLVWQDILFSKYQRCFFNLNTLNCIVWIEALLWQDMTIQKWTLDIYIIIHRQFHLKIGPNLGIFMTLLNTSVHLWSCYRLVSFKLDLNFFF